MPAQAEQRARCSAARAGIASAPLSDPLLPFVTNGEPARARISRAHLSLRFVFYRVSGVFYATPTREILEMVVKGLVECIVCIRPPPSKADPTGSRYGASPICSKYHPTDAVNFAREMVEYELMRYLWLPEERELAPLLLNKSNKCWRKAELSHVFLQLLLQIVPATETHKFSVLSPCILSAFSWLVLFETLARPMLRYAKR